MITDPRRYRLEPTFAIVPFALFVVLALSRAAHAQNPLTDRVEKAVERGVAALRELQQPNGSWGTYGAGSTSLAALALLECGVKTDDPIIVKAAEFVRTEIAPSSEVYHVSLAILLLDRLGERGDEPLIQSLAVRLLEGQHPYSGWNYRCGKPTDEEVRRLRTAQQQGAELRTNPNGAPPADSTKLDPDIEGRLKALEKNGQPNPAARGDGSPHSVAWPDNSNSQFAVLAVWVSRRHGINTDAALRRVEAWYRATFDNGTWAYMRTSDAHGRASTTCAGLIGLAAGAGVVRAPSMKTNPDKPTKPVKRDALADAMIQTALNFVGRELAVAATHGIPPGGSPERDYCFLWSLERVAMIYSLNKIGGIDWYAIGASLILQHQQANGSWRGRYAPEIDSSFALLFLRRSNLFPDLSTALRNKDKQQPALTSKDADDAKLGPAAPAAVTEADRLSRELVTADLDRGLPILERMRDEKGAEYTDALAKVIPQLKDDIQRRARDALAERLARMTPATLRTRLRDPNVEMRRAAALACAAKDDRSLAADLIAALDDKNTGVVRAVAVALRSITGEDFGPANNANAEERAKAIAAWKAWWKKQSP